MYKMATFFGVAVLGHASQYIDNDGDKVNHDYIENIHNNNIHGNDEKYSTGEFQISSGLYMKRKKSLGKKLF